MDDSKREESLRAIEAAIRSTGMLAFSGEVQLLEWSKSTSREPPKVKFGMLDDESLAPFEMATVRKGKKAGQIYHVFVIPVSEDAAAPEPDPAAKPERKPNTLARQLHSSGYFRKLIFWNRMHDHGIYTSERHHGYVTHEPCFFCKEAGGHAVKVSDSKWLLAPVCESHRNAIADSPKNMVEMARSHALGLVEQGMKDAMKDYLGIGSLSEMTPEMLVKFNDELGLD